MKSDALEQYVNLLIFCCVLGVTFYHCFGVHLKRISTVKELCKISSTAWSLHQSISKQQDRFMMATWMENISTLLQLTFVFTY